MTENGLELFVATFGIGDLCSLLVRISLHSETEFYVSKLLYFHRLHLTPKTLL